MKKNAKSRAACERALRQMGPARGREPDPIANMLRACAERIDAGEPWQSALGDYGLILLATPSNLGRAGAAGAARSPQDASGPA